MSHCEPFMCVYIIYVSSVSVAGSCVGFGKRLTVRVVNLCLYSDHEIPSWAAGVR